jgi:alpha-D-xyloside xylohydrolase
MLYDDDGETFNYEKGEYSFREIKVERNTEGLLTGTISEAQKGKPNTVGNVTWRFMTGAIK